jgi:hypothetical protein
MSTSLLYHGFGIQGDKYVHTVCEDVHPRFSYISEQIGKLFSAYS